MSAPKHGTVQFLTLQYFHIIKSLSYTKSFQSVWDARILNIKKNCNSSDCPFTVSTRYMKNCINKTKYIFHFEQNV